MATDRPAAADTRLRPLHNVVNIRPLLSTAMPHLNIPVVNPQRLQIEQLRTAVEDQMQHNISILHRMVLANLSRDPIATNIDFATINHEAILMWIDAINQLHVIHCRRLYQVAGAPGPVAAFRDATAYAEDLFQLLEEDFQRNNPPQIPLQGPQVVEENRNNTVRGALTDMLGIMQRWGALWQGQLDTLERPFRYNYRLRIAYHPRRNFLESQLEQQNQLLRLARGGRAPHVVVVSGLGGQAAAPSIRPSI